MLMIRLHLDYYCLRFLGALKFLKIANKQNTNQKYSCKLHVQYILMLSAFYQNQTQSH